MSLDKEEEDREYDKEFGKRKSVAKTTVKDLIGWEKQGKVTEILYKLVGG